MTDLEKLKAEMEAVNRLQAWLDAEDGSHFGQHEKDIETLIDLARQSAEQAARVVIATAATPALALTAAALRALAAHKAELKVMLAEKESTCL